MTQVTATTLTHATTATTAVNSTAAIITAAATILPLKSGIEYPFLQFALNLSQ